MIRGLYITGTVIAFAYMIASIVMVIYTKDLRNDYYSTYDYSYDDYGDRPYVATTRLMGALSALALFFYIFLYIYGMVKAKTTTVLVIGIIGLLFTAIAMLFDLFMVIEARSTSFDEIGPLFSTWAFFMMAFCIPCAIVTGQKQLEEHRRKKEMQKMMMQNQYHWQQYYQQQYQQQQQQQYNPQQQQQQQQYNPQQQYFNPQQFNQQQQYYANPAQQQQQFNQNPNQYSQSANQQNQNPSVQQNENQNQNPEQKQNPYEYFNPFNPPVPPQQNTDTPPENKG